MVNFILSYLKSVISIKLVMHSSAIFMKDGEEIEIHLPINCNTILDIDELQIADFFGEAFEKLTDLEEFPTPAGSGLAFLKIRRYWFSMVECQLSTQ